MNPVERLRTSVHWMTRGTNLEKIEVTSSDYEDGTWPVNASNFYILVTRYSSYRASNDTEF